ncbi:MAG: hypothetical protein BWY91_02003 [bacterium ADurb.BinA028]|nr:MAG: hypothetical protein BWY91_02003 [bacterium ADurb.BinA028]
MISSPSMASMSSPSGASVAARAPPLGAAGLAAREARLRVAGAGAASPAPASAATEAAAAAALVGRVRADALTGAAPAPFAAAASPAVAAAALAALALGAAVLVAALTAPVAATGAAAVFAAAPLAAAVVLVAVGAFAAAVGSAVFAGAAFLAAVLVGADEAADASLCVETVDTVRFAVAATARVGASMDTVIPCSSIARSTAFIRRGGTCAASSASRTSAPVTLPMVDPRAISFCSCGCENSVGRARSAPRELEETCDTGTDYLSPCERTPTSPGRHTAGRSELSGRGRGGAGNPWEAVSPEAA